MIDDETQEIIRGCYAEAKQIPTDKRDKLEKIAQVLLEKEKMDEHDILSILGPRVPEAKPSLISDNATTSL